MGFLGDIFGGGSSGPKGANLTTPATQAQADEQYKNVQGGLAQQQNLVNALGAQNGIGNQQQAYSMALNTAQGNGPNPALAQLANATGQNVAQQSALLGSQRGASANAGLQGRQAAMQGANIQQQGAGQAAALQAEQQLAAQNQLAGIAQQQVGNQIGATQGYGQQALGAQGNVLGAIGGFNNAQVSNQAALNQANQANRGFQGNIIGGIASAIPGVGSALGGFFGKKATPVLTAGGAGDAGNPFDDNLNAAHGGEIPQMSGARSKTAAHCMKAGGKVAGKASVPGDSLKNDTVPTMLSPGEVVIPRSVMNSADPADAAAKFVAAIMARKGHK